MILEMTLSIVVGQYQPSTLSNPTVADIRDESDPTILYVAGEYLRIQCIQCCCNSMTLTDHVIF